MSVRRVNVCHSEVHLRDHGIKTRVLIFSDFNCDIIHLIVKDRNVCHLERLTDLMLEAALNKDMSLLSRLNSFPLLIFHIFSANRTVEYNLDRFN